MVDNTLASNLNLWGPERLHRQDGAEIDLRDLVYKNIEALYSKPLLVSSSVDVTKDNTPYLVNATTGNKIITLPNATLVTGKIFFIKKTDSSANTVTIDSDGGTIDGAATQVLTTQYESIIVVSDGTNWAVIGDNTVDGTSIQKINIAENGVVLAARKGIDFKDSATVLVTLTDDPGNNEVDISFEALGTLPVLTGDRVVVTDAAGTITTDDRARWDGTNNRLGINLPAAPITRFQVSADGNGTSISSGLYSPSSSVDVFTGTSQGNALAYLISASGTDVFRGTLLGVRSRGSLNSPTIVSSGDQCFAFQAGGYDGSNVEFTSSITFLVDGTTALNQVPMRIEFETSPALGGVGNRATRFVVKSDGSVIIGVNQTPAGLFHLDGSADRIQAFIAAHTTQAADILEVQNSSGVKIFALPNASGMKWQFGFQAVSQTNGEAVTITKGQVVRSSAAGTVLLSKADALSTAPCLGFAVANIASAASGSIAWDGFLDATAAEWDAVCDESIPTGLEIGSWYYVSPTNAGQITSTEPTSPNYSTAVGYAHTAIRMVLP